MAENYIFYTIFNTLSLNITKVRNCKLNNQAYYKEFTLNTSNTSFFELFV